MTKEEETSLTKKRNLSLDLCYRNIFILPEVAGLEITMIGELGISEDTLTFHFEGLLNSVS